MSHQLLTGSQVGVFGSSGICHVSESVRIRHFDECEAARLARVTVGNDIHALHAAVCGESRMEIVLGSLIAEISDKYACHKYEFFLR